MKEQTGFIWPRIGTTDSSCGRPHKSFIKGEGFVCQLSDYQLLNKDLAPWK
jgi:hypothetical protein